MMCRRRRLYIYSNFASYENPSGERILELLHIYRVRVNL